MRGHRQASLSQEINRGCNAPVPLLPYRTLSLSLSLSLDESITIDPHQ